MLHEFSKLPFGKTTIRTSTMDQMPPITSIEMIILPPPPFDMGRKITIESETTIAMMPWGTMITLKTTITVMPLSPFDTPNDDFSWMDEGTPDVRDFDFAGWEGQMPMSDWREVHAEPESPYRPLLEERSRSRWERLMNRLGWRGVRNWGTPW